MEEQKNECCICLESENVNLVMIQCHLSHVVCVNCYNKISKCPICRCPIKECDNIINIEELLEMCDEIKKKKYIFTGQSKIIITI
jgi:hypothetical protein